MPASSDPVHHEMVVGVLRTATDLCETLGTAPTYLPRIFEAVEWVSSAEMVVLSDVGVVLYGDTAGASKELGRITGEAAALTGALAKVMEEAKDVMSTMSPAAAAPSL